MQIPQAIMLYGVAYFFTKKLLTLSALRASEIPRKV